MVQKITVEIASYPKCGNTWMRHLVGELFGIDVPGGIPDIHEKGLNTRSLMTPVTVRDEVRFYKSHVCANAAIKPDKIILIYRHPLDVFLSSLNYFYIEKRKSFFLGGVEKSVEQIKQDAELDFYFDGFLRGLGKDYYRDMLGGNSNYSNYLRRALANRNCCPIRYEDLIDRPVEAFADLLSRLLPHVDWGLTSELFDRVDERTKRSGKPFFWRATKGAYREFLTLEQIDVFEKRHGRFLRRLGY
jgi:hypothetical protein